jgi:hypothetical protein
VENGVLHAGGPAVACRGGGGGALGEGELECTDWPCWQLLCSIWDWRSGVGACKLRQYCCHQHLAPASAPARARQNCLGAANVAAVRSRVLVAVRLYNLVLISPPVLLVHLVYGLPYAPAVRVVLYTQPEVPSEEEPGGCPACVAGPPAGGTWSSASASCRLAPPNAAAEGAQVA